MHHWSSYKVYSYIPVTCHLMLEQPFISCSYIAEPLLDLLIQLITLRPESCQKEHVWVYLGSYGATLSVTGKTEIKLSSELLMLMVQDVVAAYRLKLIANIEKMWTDNRGLLLLYCKLTLSLWIKWAKNRELFFTKHVMKCFLLNTL